MNTISKDQLLGAMNILRAAADAIKTAGAIPSGELYAAMMPSGISLEQYEKIISMLKNANLISEESHMLRWIA